MAHRCPDCDTLCYCMGDTGEEISDRIFESCKCCEVFDMEHDDELDDDVAEFDEEELEEEEEQEW